MLLPEAWHRPVKLESPAWDPRICTLKAHAKFAVLNFRIYCMVCNPSFTCIVILPDLGAVVQFQFLTFYRRKNRIKHWDLLASSILRMPHVPLYWSYWLFWLILPFLWWPWLLVVFTDLVKAGKEHLLCWLFPLTSSGFLAEWTSGCVKRTICPVGTLWVPLIGKHLCPS